MYHLTQQPFGIFLALRQFQSVAQAVLGSHYVSLAGLELVIAASTSPGDKITGVHPMVPGIKPRALYLLGKRFTN